MELLSSALGSFVLRTDRRVRYGVRHLSACEANKSVLKRGLVCDLLRDDPYFHGVPCGRVDEAAWVQQFQS